MDNKVMNKTDQYTTIRVESKTYEKLLKLKASTGATIKWLVDSAIDKMYPNKRK